METLMNENLENVMETVEDVTPVTTTVGSSLGEKAIIAVGAVLLWEGGKFAFKKLKAMRFGIKTEKNVVNTDSDEFQNAKEVEAEDNE